MQCGTSVRKLIDYNHSLDENAVITRLSERYFEQKFNELELFEHDRGKLYWLTMARLNELILFCAGNYADSFEFSAAGDLLINPRLILVHRKNLKAPVAKERHRNLSEQFQPWASDNKQIIEWLKDETTLEIKKKPLLPYAYELLNNSGFITDYYLESVDSRMKKVADTVGFFASPNFVDSVEYFMRLQNIPDSEKAFLKSKLCGFDMELFTAIGHDFHQLMTHCGYTSRFIQ